MIEVNAIPGSRMADSSRLLRPVGLVKQVDLPVDDVRPGRGDSRFLDLLARREFAHLRPMNKVSRLLDSNAPTDLR